MSDNDDTQLNTIEEPYPTQVIEHKHAVVDDDGGDAEDRELQSTADAQDPEGDFMDNDDEVVSRNGLTEGQYEDVHATVPNKDNLSENGEGGEDGNEGPTETVGEKSNAIDYAAANGDFDDDSELSDLDEEQFKDFDGAAPGEEPAVFNLPSFRKKKGGAKAEKKSRQVRRGSLSDDDGKIYSDDEERPRKETGPRSKIPPRPTDPEELRKWELDRAMDAAIAPTKKRRKKDEDDLIASMDDEIVQLAEKMRLAAQADAEANASKKIATAKLRLLPEVTRILRSQTLYDSILDNNMLVSMKHWLEPLPDKSLPALNIQRTIFEALQALPIKTEHLRESGVGKVVLFYKKSKKPEQFIQVQANNLISEWSRPIIRKSASHKTKRVKTADYDGPSSTPRLTSSLSQQSPVSQYKSKGGTSIPRGEKAYDVAPRARELSGIQVKSDGGEAYKRMKNTLKDLGKRTGKKGGVSIEGRGIP
ncbi:Transcription factor iws1 [Taphrina deformans PYCC 5710]|uniref:Transcription factor iws1 n=1 Tax=Taphrina deformans (strain PYCC 5710 / ATCC 11124 / CBS 356.35 / IMI 108563 / JCM 9778 / NBRC 8474) TaxID=1097556 RepID=R4X699_TAPDE|nr:Transcription factor iws1 [Taphrina deformans PYCC 5710]|eukprot:CCG80524.1 Transcription factor iws1 [Taphrina deformans PYCC 5710]